MRTKITLIGAGSTVFAKHILQDVLQMPSLQDCHIMLFDPDDTRLDFSLQVGRRLAEVYATSALVEASTDIEKALTNAHYVITMFQVGGYRPSTVIDFEIPKKYGLQQTIGDTVGIGGIMRALRTVPVLLEYAQKMEQFCPDALLLNYVNPMVINSWALSRKSVIRSVGLCHSVPHTALQLAGDLHVPPEELQYLVAGINHLAFFLRLEHKGKDLYPLLRKLPEGKNFPPQREVSGKKLSDAVRYATFEKFGYFVTESSEHLSEYVPWFIKPHRPDLIGQYQIPLEEYIRRCEIQIKEWNIARSATNLLQEIQKEPHSGEYASHIIDSIEANQPRCIYTNITNHNSIRNLPAEVPVEIPCLVDHNGIQATVIGDIPPQLAALMQTNIGMQQMTVEASLHHKKDYVYQAALLDPHTAAVLSIDQTCTMVDELIAAHGKYIPDLQ